MEPSTDPESSSNRLAKACLLVHRYLQRQGVSRALNSVTAITRVHWQPPIHVDIPIPTVFTSFCVFCPETWKWKGWVRWHSAVDSTTFQQNVLSTSCVYIWVPTRYLLDALSCTKVDKTTPWSSRRLQPNKEDRGPLWQLQKASSWPSCPASSQSNWWCCVWVFPSLYQDYQCFRFNRKYAPSRRYK